MKRVAMITGGSSGIGLACASKLKAEGFEVAIVDLAEEKGLALATSLECQFIQADLSTRTGCKTAVEHCVAHYGALDVLVNNAGYQSINAIKDFAEDTWDNMLALMLSAPFLLSKYAWDYLIKRGQGRVINMGSAHSLTASPYKSAYVTAKHGLVGLTRTLALEGGDYGLTANVVAPAYVRTPLVEAQIADQARTRGISPAEVESKVFLENVALKKLLEPEDVAALVAFLASEAAWGITGSVQSIDLGWTAR